MQVFCPSTVTFTKASKNFRNCSTPLCFSSVSPSVSGFPVGKGPIERCPDQRRPVTVDTVVHRR